MPLNFKKVEKLLYENKFIITGFYIYEGKCRYLKIFSIEFGETIILYIDADGNYKPFNLENPKEKKFWDINIMVPLLFGEI